MRFLDRLSGKKKIVLLVATALLGVLLVLGGALGEKGGEGGKNGGAQEKNPAASAYIEGVENKIRNITEQITGSKDAAVIVSVKSGTEYIYVSNEEHEGDRSATEYIKLRGENGEDSLILYKEVYPAVSGISVACRGGDDPVIRQKLIEVISTALGVPSHRICIVGTKS